MTPSVPSDHALKTGRHNMGGDTGERAGVWFTIEHRCGRGAGFVKDNCALSPVLRKSRTHEASDFTESNPMS
eukprot:2139799-Rhodomonas_salina.2